MSFPKWECWRSPNGGRAGPLIHCFGLFVSLSLFLSLSPSLTPPPHPPGGFAPPSPTVHSTRVPTGDRSTGAKAPCTRAASGSPPLGAVRARGVPSQCRAALTSREGLTWLGGAELGNFEPGNETHAPRSH